MNNENVEEVLKTEAELAEVLLGLLKQQQNAIVHFRDTEMHSIVEQQQSILRPLEALERERSVLFKRQENLEGAEVQKRRHKLKTLVKQIVDVNIQNKVLLETSLKFIQQNLRIITDNYSKQLLDAKI